MKPSIHTPEMTECFAKLSKLDWNFAMDLKSHILTIEEKVFDIFEYADDENLLKDLHQILACARSAKIMFTPDDFENLEDYLRKTSK